jgi:hypothetical protein
MRTSLPAIFIVVVVAATLLSSGCEKNAVPNPTAQSTPGSTKILEAADLVGYDGKRLRGSVDRIKEARKKQNQELEKIAGNGPDQ